MASFIQATATFIVAAIVAYIAWQQWMVSRDRLRLDLFDRRYRVYQAVRKFGALVLEKDPFNQSQLDEFFEMSRKMLDSKRVVSFSVRLIPFAATVADSSSTS